MKEPDKNIVSVKRETKKYKYRHITVNRYN